MKKVYVIGAGVGDIGIATAKRVLELQQDCEVICVERMEDIPAMERMSSDPSVIQQIHKFSAPPILPEMTFYDLPKKQKGYERPYKYHK